MNAVIGRWGFYPCAVELYRKLKRLNFLAFEARRRSAAWERWNRKEPQNRLLYKRTVSTDSTGTRYVTREVIGPAPEPLSPPLEMDIADVIYNDYRSARFPVVEEKLVKKLVLKEAQIDKLLAELAEWYSAPTLVTIK